MAMKRFPSPAHEHQPEAYWLEGPANDLWLGKQEQRILQISGPAAERILDLLQRVRTQQLFPVMYCCNDVARYVFGEQNHPWGSPKIVAPRGRVMGPDEASRRLVLPCSLQLQDPGCKHDPVVHSAVLLGMDEITTAPDARPADTAVVLHKPGTGELEICTLRAAIAQYDGKYQEIAYHGQSRTS